MAGAPIELIKRVPLFSELDNSELKAVAGSMVERTFSAGDTVTTEGKSGVGFFVVVDGTAAVSIGGSEIRKLGPGDYFGEVALIANVNRTATITANTDMHCFGMTPWEFRPLVQAQAPIAWKLLQTLAYRLAEAEQRTST